jgi:predicted nuclease of predicted toxin-antitoxin system
VPQIKFYLDENVPAAVCKSLRRRGIDVLATQEVGRGGLPDDAQLAFALHEGRVMVTLDSDLIALAGRGAEHAGIAYAKPGTRSIGELVRALLLIHGTLEPADMIGHIEYL